MLPSSSVMVYSEVGEGDSPEEVARCVYVVAAVKLWVVMVIIINCCIACLALQWISE